MTKLPSSPLSTTTTLSQSYDSIIPSEEEESERHKFSNVARRGSRLSDIINLKVHIKHSNSVISVLLSSGKKKATQYQEASGQEGFCLEALGS